MSTTKENTRNEEICFWNVVRKEQIFQALQIGKEIRSTMLLFQRELLSQFS